MQPNDPEITNPKSVTDNSVILNAVDMLLTSAGFNKDILIFTRENLKVNY